MKTLVVAALSLSLLFALPTSAQTAANAPAYTGSGRIQNIPSEEMWKRVTQCVFPTYPGLAFNSHIAGTVDIGLGISPEGEVANYRVLVGQPLLVQPAVDAIRQWKFRPNVVQGEVTWSRVRALVRFNADGTTAVDLAPGILADNFGDPGTPRSAANEFPRPASSPECKAVQPWIGAEAKEIEASEVSPGLNKNNYFGLTFHFPSEWRVADRDTLDSMESNQKRVAESQYPANFQGHLASLPFYLLFFARTDGPIGSPGPSVQIWAEKEVFIHSAKEYFPNRQFLSDKSADGTRGPQEVKISGRTYYRADRWGKDENRDVYQVRLVTYARDLIVGIDVMADSAATAEQLVKSLEGISLDDAAGGPVRSHGQQSAAMAPAQTTARATGPQPSKLAPLVYEGRQLTAEQATALEEQLKTNPEDLATRTRLLGYYFTIAKNQIGVPATIAARRRHILWLVEHHPDSNLLDGSDATIDPSGHPLADADGYAKVKVAWLEQTEKHKNSAAVLGRAAWFFKTPDKEIAADLLKRAHSLEPQVPAWSEGLGLVYATGILGVTTVNQNRFPTGVDPELAKGPVAQKFREELAKCDDPAATGAAGYFLAFHGGILAASGKAPPDVFQLAEKYLAGAVAAHPGNSGLQEMLSTLYQTLAMHAASPDLRAGFMKKRLATLEMAPASSDPQRRLNQLPVLVTAAFDAGEMEKASNYAAESLRLAEDHQGQPGYDMAIHKANIALGRLALRQSDVEKAKACLLAAGHVHGDPALSSFGPNMSLAKELLEKGEREVVLQYFELCQKFWPYGSRQLAAWKLAVEKGELPQFGANLIY